MAPFQAVDCQLVLAHARMIFAILAMATCDVLAGDGAFECPCLTNSSATWSAISTELVSHGHPSDYGLQGCSAYDTGLVQSGCSLNEASFCQSEWCYVDVEACNYDEEECIGAGGLPGSYASPYCRTRLMVQSSLLSTPGALYSYETCGYRNSYDLSAIMEPVAGTVVTFAADEWGYYIYKTPDPANPNITEIKGVDYDFFMGLAENFDPTPTITYVPGFSTTLSRSMFSSAWTACVHDVEVGNVDACVGPFWITSERSEMAQFLPVSQDLFYFITTKYESSQSLGSLILAPFKPFSADAWFAIVGFLIGVSLLLWVIDRWENGCRGGYRSQVDGLFETVYNTFKDFLTGGVTASSLNLPTKFVTFGLAFFILIVAASYAASLTSMLVMEKVESGAFQSIEEAIDKGVTICVPVVIAPAVKVQYPSAQFLELSDSRSLPRRIHGGECGSGILASTGISLLESGGMHERDCKMVEQGELESEYHCKTDAQGNVRNDCNLIVVGDVLTSVGLGFPVSDDLAKSLSWAVTASILRGDYSAMQKKHEAMSPRSQCESEDIDPEGLEGLPLEALVGVILIGGIFSCISVVLLVSQVFLYFVRTSPPCRPDDETSGVNQDDTRRTYDL